MLIRIAISIAAAVAASAVIVRIIDHRIGIRMRMDPAEFRAKALRVNSLLADVPLHDVWMVHLPGGGEGRSIRDVRSMLSENEDESQNVIVGTLIKLRLGLGRIFGWDDEKHFDHAASYIHRLSERDWRQSYDEPGEEAGLFRMVYTFEHESVAEIINGTAHAFLAMVLEPTDDGYTLYYAVYVKPVSRITPFYMALINPFRRLFVYPSMLGMIERAWVAEWGSEEEMPAVRERAFAR